jgi:hypothetical protein
LPLVDIPCCPCSARREDLKACYSGLLEVLPTLAEKPNAAKGVILEHGRAEIEALEEEFVGLESELRELRNMNAMLLAQQGHEQSHQPEDVDLHLSPLLKL